MAFDASSLLPEKGYARARGLALNLKGVLTTFNAQLAAGNVGYDVILDRLAQIVEAVATWQQVAAIPGIAAYAQAQKADPAYDVAAEFTAMVDAAEDVLAWLSTNVPNGGTPDFFTDGPSLSPTGALVWRQYTPAQTPTFRAVISALTATIG